MHFTLSIHIFTEKKGCRNDSWRGHARNGRWMLQHLPLTALQPLLYVCSSVRCNTVVQDYTLCQGSWTLCQVADLNFFVVQQYETNEKTSIPDHVFGGTDILTDLPDVKDQEPLLLAVLVALCTWLQSKHIRCCYMKHMVPNNVVTLLFERPPYKYV
jgi:hypothetical protein